jgi:enoyl-CoA hydratase/carnithine racemase
MDPHIHVHGSDAVCEIEIRRPETKNALNTSMYAALAEAIEQAETDVTVRVLLLTGQSGFFTSGNDIQDFLKILDVEPKTLLAPLRRFMQALSTARKPVLAAVSGHAIGIGTTMLLHCDLVYASGSAQFALPFTRLGLCPEFGSSLLLPRLTGYQQAAALLLAGEMFDAKRARDLGLVNEITETEQLLALARSKARALAQLPPEAIRLSKKLLKQHLEAALAQRIDEEITVFVERLRSDEARAALAAFMSKSRSRS